MKNTGDEIYCVDAHYERIGCAAVYIMKSGGRVALIESAVNSSLPYVIKALAELSLTPESVELLCLSHVHLDHAGGAGLYMQMFPNARLIVHPRGARHMADPSKLLAGVREVYGAAEVDRMYGKVIPVSRERIIEAADGLTLEFGKRKLVCFDSPGHAKHHTIYFEEASRSLFSGDAFGISYEEMTVPAGRWIIPTTAPVQFDPAAMKATVDKILSLAPKRVLLTHFGVLNNVNDAAQQLRDCIDAYIEIAEKQKGVYERIKDSIRALHIDMARKYGMNDPLGYADHFLELDTKLNAQGLALWYGRRQSGKEKQENVRVTF